MKNSKDDEVGIFEKIPSFTCNEETLSLVEIIKTKKVISVTIGYLSAVSKEKADGLKGFFGRKKIVQSEKEVTINDEQGITIYFTEGTVAATIRFWKKEEFSKLDDGNYDESTLWRRYIMNIVHPYQFNFHIGNLKKVEWIEK